MLLQQTQSAQVTEMLNDLVKINSDRISRYQKAIDKTNLDSDLQCVFQKIISESKKHKEQLLEKMHELGITPQDVMGISGQIHRAWMDLCVVFTGNTRKGIMASCQYNEDIIHHAYTAALSVDLDMFEDIRELIEKQLKTIKNISADIKNCRDEYYLANTTMKSFQYSPMVFS